MFHIIAELLLVFPYSSATGLLMPQRPRSRIQSTAARQWQRERAASQTRESGHFARDHTNPESSGATLRRLARSLLAGSPDDRERTCRDFLCATLVSGDLKDHVTAQVDRGPLVLLYQCLVTPPHRPSKRKVFRLAKEFYMERRRVRSIPRRDLKRNGVIMKTKAFVFSRFRLPDPESQSEMSRLEMLIARLIQSEKAHFPAVASAMDAVKPILQTYNRTTKEFKNYLLGVDGRPLAPDTLSDVPATSNGQANAQPENNRSGNLDSSNTQEPLIPLTPEDMLYVQTIECTASNNKEYILLKRILSNKEEDLMLCLGDLFAKHAQKNNQDQELTTVEKAIVGYCSESQPEKREQIRMYLNQFLACCVQIRKALRKDLHRDAGHHPSDAELCLTD